MSDLVSQVCMYVTDMSVCIICMYVCMREVLVLVQTRGPSL